VFTCSVKRVVGVEDCGEEAKGESTDAKRHVKASVPETLEHLYMEKTKVKASELQKTCPDNTIIMSSEKACE